jgi:hypothetical protein
MTDKPTNHITPLGDVIETDVFNNGFDQRRYDLVEFELLHCGFASTDQFVLDFLDYLDDVVAWRCGAEDRGGVNDELISRAHETISEMLAKIQSGAIVGDQSELKGNIVHLRQAVNSFLINFPVRLFKTSKRSPVIDRQREEAAARDMSQPAKLSATGPYKSREQIDALKANWRDDPCYDLEDVDGFGRYHDELLAYRKETEAKWAARSQAELTDFAESIGVLNNVKLAEFLRTLSDRIGELGEQFDDHVNGE